MVLINDRGVVSVTPKRAFYCRTRRFQMMATGGATVGAFGLGTVLAWTSPAIPSLDKEQQFGVISADTKAILASLVPLGALVSCPLTGYLVDRNGRKTTMLLMSAPFVLGWLLITYARTLTMMNIGRFLTGFCSGAFSIAAPLFISEIAQDEIRGMLGTGYQVMVTFGILFTYVLGAFVNWEILALTCGFLPLVFLVLMIFMPESPRYSLINGNVTEAKDALRWLRGADSHEAIEEELQMIKQSIDASQMEEFKICNWKKTKFLKPNLLVLSLFFIQQFSGINYVIFFSQSIFSVAGGAGSGDNDSSVIIVGVVQFAGTVASGVLVDRVGRRKLLIVSSSFMTVSLTAIGVFFYLRNSDKYIPGLTSWLPLVSLMVYIIAYSIGYGPVPLLLMAEFLPLNRKGLFCGICTSFNWALAFLITQFIASLEEVITIQWCFWSFATCSFLGTIFVIFNIPETKGKSLDEIQDYFKKPSK